MNIVVIMVLIFVSVIFLVPYCCRVMVAILVPKFVLVVILLPEVFIVLILVLRVLVVVIPMLRVTMVVILVF